MTSIESLYENLKTGRNMHLTNKKENIERVMNGLTMIDPTFSDHDDYQRGIAVARSAAALYEMGDYAAAAIRYKRALDLLDQFQEITGQRIPMKIPTSKKVKNAVAKLQAANAKGGKRTRTRRRSKTRSRKH